MNGRRRVARALLAALVLGLAAGGAPGQDRPGSPRLRAAAGVSPDTVTVGDRFGAVLRVTAPGGSRVAFGPLPASDSVQAVAPLRASLDTRGGAVAVYTLAAWAAGDSLRAEVPVTISLASGASSEYRAPLRLPVVRSVLPAEGEEVRPRPARGLLPLPGSRAPWWPWWLAAGLLAALAVAVALRLRLRRTRPAPPVDPHAAALAELDRIAAMPVTSATDAERVVTLATRALRVLLAQTHRELGEDLTSREVVLALGRSWNHADGLRELSALLARGDRVKFARAAADAEDVRGLVGAARAWVVGFARSDRQEAA